MAHTLLLEVPEDVYTSLVETAENEGQSPEVVAARCLTTAVRGSELDPPDPFEKWIGALPVGVPGWADDHDRYIGESLYASMHDGEPQSEPQSNP